MADIVSSSKSMTEDMSKKLDPTGLDVVEIIIMEHRLVDALYERFQSERSDKERQGCAHNIIKLLSIHSVCEEAALYPWMKKNLPEGEKLVNHAIKEHQEIKDDLYALDSSSLGDAGYEAKLARVMKDTQHHVEEEESDLLPTIKRKASKEELDYITQQFISAKSMAPSRPHPSAPTEPPQNKVVAAATMPVDAVRDMGRFST